MDANGSKSYLLLGFDDWADCLDQSGQPLRNSWQSSPPLAGNGLQWDGRRFDLTLEPLEFSFPTSPRDNIPSLDDRRSGARDRFGNWYWIGPNRLEIRVNSVVSGAESHFWSAADPTSGAQSLPDTFEAREAKPLPAALALAGLAITEDNYLVVGAIDPPGLLIFDLFAGAAPRQLLWPRGIPFAPFDIAPAPGGGAWVLDRVNRCYWGIDRQFGVIRPTPAAAQVRIDDFQPMDRSTVRRSESADFPAGFRLDVTEGPSPVDPISIEALSDGSVLILDRNPQSRFSQVFRYSLGQQLGDPASAGSMANLMPSDEAPGFDLIAHDFAYLPSTDGGQSLDRLYIVSRTGNQSFAFRLVRNDATLRLDPLAEYLPMRLFGGKGLVTSGSQVYYDFGASWIPLIHQSRPRYRETATLLTPARPSPGAAQRPAFDGVEPGCVWHRLMIDARIPPDASLQVWSRASDDETQLGFIEWRQEPRPYLRGDGSEQPFAPAVTGDGNGTWELLLQNARGRFLQLKLTLGGTGKATPRLRALRVYYPRFSYLIHYLPAVYRDDPQSASFLDRFLANIEGFFTSIEDEIASVQILFDTLSAPPAALDWLASWFGMALDPNWNDSTRRLFIRHAMDFFQCRGTVRGLQIAMRLAFEQCPAESVFTDSAAQAATASKVRIVEKFLTRQSAGVSAGDPTDQVVGPRMGSSAARWKPSDGRSALNERYRAYLTTRITGTLVFAEFPIIEPDGAEATFWESFAMDVLGFVPAASADDLQLWQGYLQGLYQAIANLNEAWGAAFGSFAEIALPADTPPDGPPADDWNEFIVEMGTGAASIKRGLWQNFLSRRYQRIGALNQAYGTSWASFAAVPIPGRLPPDGPALLDWYQFESVVMAMQRTAHRFSVLLPASGTGVTAAVRRQQIALAERILNLEKPAHAVFDVKFYWAFFRIGEARLGLDTVIDLGGRSPQLLTPMTLGQGYLAEGYLTPPYEIANRQVLGRDPLQ